MSIKLGPKPDDITVTKKGNLTYTYLKSKEKNGGAIRSLSLLSNTEVWTGHWGNDIISLHNLREDKTISITLGHTPARRYNSDKDREFNIYLLQTQYMY